MAGSGTCSSWKERSSFQVFGWVYRTWPVLPQRALSLQDRPLWMSLSLLLLPELGRFDSLLILSISWSIETLACCLFLAIKQTYDLQY